MPRPHGPQLATPPTTQQSKTRRPAVKWDHRKDKYMLLAIFAQMNIRAPDFKQLSDMLGSDHYSAETLKKRFRDLEQMATEVMEDRQERVAEAVENGSDDDATLVNEPLPAQNTPPSSNNSSPNRRTNQPQNRAERPEASSSPTNGPAARRRQRNKKQRGPPNPSGNPNNISLGLHIGEPQRIEVPVHSQRGVHKMSEGRSPPRGPASGWRPGTWRDGGRNFHGRGSNQPGFSGGPPPRFQYRDNPQITTVSVNNGPMHRYFET